MSDQKRDSEGPPGGFGRNEARAYQGALEAVLSIPIGLGLGYWADRAFDSSPIGLAIGAALGFAAFVRRLVSMRSLVPPAADGDNSRQTPQADQSSAPSETDEK